MPYQPTSDLAEAERRLDAAMDIPGWPISTEYAGVMHGERTARRLSIIASRLTGVLRIEPLVRATNQALRNGNEALGNAQVNLVLVRSNVVDLNVRTGSLAADIIMPDTVLDLREIRRKCPGAEQAQRDRLEEAQRDGWQIKVVPETAFLAATSQYREPYFVSSFIFSGMPMSPSRGVYILTDEPNPDLPHEFWHTDPARIEQEQGIHNGLKAIAVPI